MPRGNLHKLAGHVLHITDRCHRKQFLLKFARDRRAWLHWLFEARRRYELCVLNYQVTCNHVHLLVFDHGRGEVARSMQLAAGRCGRAHNSFDPSSSSESSAPNETLVERWALDC